MQKLDTFKGKITSKDSKAHVAKVLGELQSYLQNYDEQDAAKIVESFKNKTDSHQDKLLSQQFLKAYSKRTETLSEIAKTLKKMQEDLVDEQDTSIKKPGIISKSVQRLKSTASNIKSKVSSTIDKFNPMNLISKFMDFKSFLPMILGGFSSVLSGGLLGIAGFMVAKTLKSIGWIGKFGFKATKWIVKKAVKGAWFISKLAFKGMKFIGGMVFKVGGIVAKLAMKGLGKIATLLGNLWKSIKEKVSPKAKTPGKGNSSTSTSKDTKPGNDSRKRSTKVGGKGNDKGWFQKSKEALDSVKKKILPSLEKQGLKGLSKAIGKSLVKLTTRAVPFLGWGLLAYDAYSAAKKSDSLMSFGVNLLDEVAGGLISAALGNKENAGQYVESLVVNNSSNPNNAVNPVTGASASSGGLTSVASTVGKSSLDIASSSKYSYDSTMQTVNSINKEQNLSSFYNNYNKHQNFDFYYNAVQNGDLTIDQAIQAMNQNIQPYTSSSTNIQNHKYEEYKQIHQSAVAEAVRISSMLDTKVVSAASQMASHAINVSTETTNIIGNLNPNHMIRHTGPMLPGSTQG